MRISDWSSDVCSSDLSARSARAQRRSSGAHLYRTAVPQRYRTAGKAVRSLHQNDRDGGSNQEAEGRGGSVTIEKKTVPSVSVSYARNGNTNKANALGMRPMQERAYEKRGEQYILIKSPPASGKSRDLMFVALDTLATQGVRQAIIVVPEQRI